MDDLTPEVALVALRAVYERLSELQAPAYRYASVMHGIEGYAGALEDAMTGLGRAMASLRETIGYELLPCPDCGRLRSERPATER